MNTIADAWMKTLDRASPLNVAETDPHGAALLLFNEHGSAIYRFCRGTLRNETDAEDVVQETFLKLLQHLRSQGDRRNLKSWLFTVAANACRDRLRWRVRWLPWDADRDERTVGPVEHSPDLERARDALRSLAARDRLLLSLRANGLSYKEIAVAAGIREQSVGRLLARAVDRWKTATDQRF